VDPWGGTDTFKNFEGFEGSRYGDTLIGPDGEDPGEFYFWQGAAGRDKFILNEDANVWTDYYNDHNAGGERGIVADLGGIANKSTGDIKGTVIDGYGHKDTTTNIRKVAGTQHDDSFKGSRLNDHFNGEQGIDGFDGGKGTDFVHMDTTHRHGGGAINVNLSLGSGQIIDDGYGNTENAFSIEGIYGSVEGDTIIGSAGANVLFGMGGQDTLTGGLGKDKFVYGFYDNGSHNEFGDQITDFVSGTDKFVFDSKYVDDLDDVVRFHNGDTATAKAGNSEFYFNAADHTLYYDSNGKGAGGVIAVAVLDGVTSLVKADILIVPGYTDVV
jgi:Ca2+-binding RTX toxin-like protein